MLQSEETQQLLDLLLDHVGVVVKLVPRLLLVCSELLKNPIGFVHQLLLTGVETTIHGGQINI